jgi:phosphopantetheinyl transferase (holo-ACP synthase)
MLGNDVVDLLDLDSDISTYRSGFDARVFRSVEREAIALGTDPNRTRWRLWAAKEAAYKALRQADPKAGFSPVRFEVAPAAGSRACVFVRGQDVEFAVRYYDGPQHVHAVALPAAQAGEFGALLIGHARIETSDPEAQSAGVRSYAAQALAEHWDIAPAALQFGKQSRRPVLRIAGKAQPTPLSFSHNGHHVVWVIGPLATDQRLLDRATSTPYERIAS